MVCITNIAGKFFFISFPLIQIAVLTAIIKGIIEAFFLAVGYKNHDLNKSFNNFGQNNDSIN